MKLYNTQYNYHKQTIVQLLHILIYHLIANIPYYISNYVSLTI